MSKYVPESLDSTQFGPKLPLMSAKSLLVRGKCPRIGMSFCPRFDCFHTHSGFVRRKKNSLFSRGTAKGAAELPIVDFGLSIIDCRFSIAAVGFDPDGRHRKGLAHGHDDTCKTYSISISKWARLVKRQSVRMKSQFDDVAAKWVAVSKAQSALLTAGTQVTLPPT
jgi:hypothetical protein